MTNNNSNNNSKFSWEMIVLTILSLLGTMVIANWIADKVSTWLADLIFPEEKKSEDQKIKVETKIEEVDEDEVPEKIKTIINGKIADRVDQFIYDCKMIKKDRIGSHKVVDKDIDDIYEVNAAKSKKLSLTAMEKVAKEYFETNGFNRQNALSFADEYFTLVNDYVREHMDNDESLKIDFELSDSIINKYFGEA